MRYRFVSITPDKSSYDDLRKSLAQISSLMFSGTLRTTTVRPLLEDFANTIATANLPKYPLASYLQVFSDCIDSNLSKADFADILSYPMMKSIYGTWRAAARLTKAEHGNPNQEKTDMAVADAILRIASYADPEAARIFHTHEVSRMLQASALRATQPETALSIHHAIKLLIAADGIPLSGQSFETEEIKKTLKLLQNKISAYND